MKLFPAGFYGIKDGKQKIEVRLNDDKRQKIHIGDIIEFGLLPDLEEICEVKVVDLLQYKSFLDLFSHISLVDWNAGNWTVEEAVMRCSSIYSKEDEAKYGVLGIKIEII